MSEKEFKFKNFEISGTDSFLNEVKLYEIDNNPSDELDESNLFYVYSDSEDNIIQIVEKLNKLSEEKQKLNKQVTYWKSVALRDKKLCGQPLVLCQGYSSKDNKRFHLAFENEEWWSICDETNNSFEGKFYGISGQEVVDLLNTLDDKNILLNQRNNELHDENKEILKDEKQLSIDFMGYKMKLVKVLQNHYLECQKWSDTHTQLIIKQIASDLGVDLE